jgi:hypothetical protein
MQCTFERRRQFGRVVDPLAIGACSGADLLDGPAIRRGRSRWLVAVHRFALRVHSHRRAPHGALIELFMIHRTGN